MGIKILLVEDDPMRAVELRELFEERLVGSFDLDVATNVHDGAERLKAQYYDLLILDILLPMRDGKEPVADGGVRLLRTIRSRSELRLPGYIVGLTAYDDLELRSRDEFTDSMWLIVHYDASSERWIDPLIDHINHILGTQAEKRGRHDYDLAVITALREIELESVLELDGNWKEQINPGDDTIYHVGRFQGPRGVLRVVATACLEMGTATAAVVSMKLIQQFRPRYIAMTGIAAGVGGNFGDILIADQSWDYGSGKTKTDASKETIFLPAPSAILLDPSLKYRLSWFRLRRSTLEKIRDAWRGNAVPGSLASLIGPVASGSSVVESEPLVKQIVSHNRKVIGVEMETYGVFLAARLCSEPRPMAMSFKSICDYGDGDKDDNYQRYAAFTSAMFLYEFAIDSLIVSSN